MLSVVFEDLQLLVWVRDGSWRITSTGTFPNLEKLRPSHKAQLHVRPAGPVFEVGICLETDHDPVPCRAQ